MTYGETEKKLCAGSAALSRNQSPTESKGSELGQVRIPEGFKLVAVGERCATPTEARHEISLTLKGSYLAAIVRPLQGRDFLLSDFRRQRETLAPGY